MAGPLLARCNHLHLYSHGGIKCKWRIVKMSNEITEDATSPTNELTVRGKLLAITEVIIVRFEGLAQLF